MKHLLALLLLALVGCAPAGGDGATAVAPLRAPDVRYEPSPHAVVRQMLELAKVGPGDVVYDLGSGDGRLPIIAAQKYGARGVGVEIDPTLVRLSRQNARDAGVSDRVVFIEGDLFTTDISAATVITLYLSTSVLRDLESKLKKELHPGTRIVSHQFWFLGWPAEQTRRVDEAELFLWRLPVP